MAARSGRDAEQTVSGKAIDGDGAPSRRCEAGRDGSAYGGRGTHGEAEVMAAAIGVEVRG